MRRTCACTCSYMYIQVFMTWFISDTISKCVIPWSVTTGRFSSTPWLWHRTARWRGRRYRRREYRSSVSSCHRWCWMRPLTPVYSIPMSATYIRFNQMSELFIYMWMCISRYIVYQNSWKSQTFSLFSVWGPRYNNKIFRVMTFFTHENLVTCACIVTCALHGYCGEVFVKAIMTIYMYTRSHTHTHARTHARMHAHTHTHTGRQWRFLTFLHLPTIHGKDVIAIIMRNWWVAVRFTQKQCTHSLRSRMGTIYTLWQETPGAC